MFKNNNLVWTTLEAHFAKYQWPPFSWKPNDLKRMKVLEPSCLSRRLIAKTTMDHLSHFRCYGVGIARGVGDYIHRNWINCYTVERPKDELTQAESWLLITDILCYYCVYKPPFRIKSIPFSIFTNFIDQFKKTIKLFRSSKCSLKDNVQE